MKDFCSVFQAETAAINCAATNIKTHKNRHITIWSDSLSALKALSNKILKQKSIADCHDTLTQLSENNDVHLRWIKAHIGHHDNEKADILAKAGTTASNQIDCFVPVKHIKNLINNKVQNINND